MSNSRPTQAARIVEYMQKYNGITQFEALRDLGVMRLASRISELRKRGYIIESKIEAVKNRFDETVYIKRYSLKVEEQQEIL